MALIAKSTKYERKHPLVITRLIGGLGNQMFQYAAGKALSHRLGTVLKLDISAFDKYNLRRYALDVFKLNAPFASSSEIARIKYGKGMFVKKLVNHVLLRRPLSLSRNVYIEPHFHYDPMYESLSDETYLKGYFQSEKYFSFIQNLIRQDFCLKSSLEEENKSMAGQISSSESVSIHIRRGDYVNDPHTNRVHGTCSPAYYNTAMQFISRKIKEPVFFCFSDDIKWVKKHLESNHPLIFIDHNRPENASEDMRLMSMCKHNIIANSSFSWWGAWLNSNPEKIVIAPKRWFQTEDYDTRDLIPENWMRL